MKIKSPIAAAACLQRLVSSTAASPPAASALNLPVLGLVTTAFVSHQTPAAVSRTTQRETNYLREVSCKLDLSLKVINETGFSILITCANCVTVIGSIDLKLRDNVSLYSTEQKVLLRS